MRKIDLIFWHTAAHSDSKGRIRDTTKEELFQWHVRERGWSDIGYHYLVRRDGTIHPCRPVARSGAHVAGVNSRSVGICLSGDGEVGPATKDQYAAAIGLTAELMIKYDVPVYGVLGHREVNDLVASGEVAQKYRTPKTCPGRYIDMTEVRRGLASITHWNRGAII